MKPFLNKFLNIFHLRRQTAFFAVLGAVFVLIVALALPNRALADFSIVEDIVVPAAGFVASVFFSLLGKLLSAIISALIQIAKYNRIIDQPTVQSTWVIMRDFVNMFFVFALLLIAFSTILRLRQYEAKQLLPKLVLYAVLVNFSLTICGLFIDIAQVVMMTFVNAFESTALNNLTSMTGLLDYGNLQLDSGTANSGEVLAGYILAIAFMVVAIITIGAMMVILLIRILMLWILAILSPFAFVLPVIPGGQKYAGQWWGMFSNYVVSGPLLAFFIWLALTVVGQNTSIGQEIIQDGGVTIVKTTVGNSGFFINFLIAIGMLFAGLMLTSSLGGAMGKIAGGASNWMQRTGTGVLTGRLGPTPMRWARERYQVYRGQRESIRKESAQRFGQGVSAIQDRQISARISGLVRGTAGQVTGAITGGRWVAGENKQRRAQQRATEHWEKQAVQVEQTHGKAGDFANQTHGQLRAMYQQEQSQSARAAIASELNRRGELGRQATDQPMIDHAMAFLRQRSPEAFKKFDDTQRTNYAKHLTAHNDEQLRNRFDAAAHDWQRAAIGQRLNDIGALGRNETRDTVIEAATRQYLIQETPDAEEKFNDTMKIKNAQFAFNRVYGRGVNLDADRVISDLNSGKLRASSLTPEMLSQLNTRLGGNGQFGNQWMRSMVDPKEMKSKLKDMEEGVLDAMANSMNIFDQSLERRTAFGEASGHWDRTFDVNNADDHTAANAQNEFRNFMTIGKNRKMFYDDGSAGTLGNQTFWDAIHSDKRLGPTENQLKNIREDPQKRNAINTANASIVATANAFNPITHQQDHSEAANRARNLQVEISGGNVLRDAAGNARRDSAGNVIEIYNINDADPGAALDAQNAMVEAISAGRLNAEDFKNEDPTTATPELYGMLSQFNNEQLAKLGQENKALVQNLINHWDAQKGIVPEYDKRLERARNDHRYTSYNIP